MKKHLLVMIVTFLGMAAAASAQMLGNPLSYPRSEKIAMGVSFGYETVESEKLSTENKLLLLRSNLQPLPGLFLVGSVGKIASSLEWSGYALPSFQFQPGYFGSVGVQFHFGFSENLPFKLVAALEERYFLLKQSAVNLADDTIRLSQISLENQEMLGSLISVFQSNHWGIYFGLQGLIQDFNLHGLIQQPVLGSSRYVQERWGSENRTGLILGIAVPLNSSLSLGLEFTNASDFGTAFHVGINQFGLLK